MARATTWSERAVGAASVKPMKLKANMIVSCHPDLLRWPGRSTGHCERLPESPIADPKRLHQFPEIITEIELEADAARGDGSRHVMSNSAHRLRIAVDIGGTFTDLAAFDEADPSLTLARRAVGDA